MTRYLHGHAEPVVASHAARTVESSAAYLLPRLRPGLRVLDIGCGPGSITLDLARRVDELLAHMEEPLEGFALELPSGI